ncbi:MAG: homocysteine S-methyltransferase family protein [Pseudomonadota bacterium]
MSVTLLDGSIGQELVHRHGKAATTFWSSSVMIENPDLLGRLHREYFAAGATIATTNSYPVLPDRLAGTALEPQLHHLLEIAAGEARAARDAHGSGRIAGALGPLGATYRTDFTHTKPDAMRIYGPVFEALEPHVDLFLAETVSSVRQARNLAHILLHLTDKPAWIALSVDDDDGTKLRSGEALEAALGALDTPRIDAVLINCARPEAIDVALPYLRDFGKPFGAYANGFTRISDAFLADSPTVDVLEARPDLAPAAYADFAMRWQAMGATILGGCCEIGPAHIAEIASRLNTAGIAIE